MQILFSFYMCTCFLFCLVFLFFSPVVVWYCGIQTESFWLCNDQSIQREGRGFCFYCQCTTSLVFVQLWARIFFPQFTPLPGLTTCSVSTCLFLPASFYLCASMCSFSVFVAYSCMVVSFESHFFTVSVDCQSFVGSVNGRLWGWADNSTILIKRLWFFFLSIEGGWIIELFQLKDCDFFPIICHFALLIPGYVYARRERKNEDKKIACVWVNEGGRERECTRVCVYCKRENELQNNECNFQLYTVFNDLWHRNYYQVREYKFEIAPIGILQVHCSEAYINKIPVP